MGNKFTNTVLIILSSCFVLFSILQFHEAYRKNELYFNIKNKHESSKIRELDFIPIERQIKMAEKEKKRKDNIKKIESKEAKKNYYEKILIDYGLEYSYYYDYLNTIKTINANELLELANKYFKKEDLSEIIVGGK